MRFINWTVTRRASAAILSLPLLFSSPIYAQSCGGDFADFVAQLKREAQTKGAPVAQVNEFFKTVEHSPKVLKADRAQAIFQLPFIEFSGKLISDHRMAHGQKNATKHKYIFDQIEGLYGIPPGVLLAFWAFETDFGAFQGNYNTRNALVTLAHDCRRPELFRPQIFAALELFLRDEFNPETTQGAWAGEIGMVQMLPQDILDNGVDGDGDGLVDLRSSPADALMSGAKMLSNMGWKGGQPWLQEVILPFDMDWGLTGLDTQKPVSNWAALGVQGANQPLYPADLESSIILPQGRFGPAFIAYPNFHVYFEWNQSFVYVTTAAYFATLLEGSPRYGFELEDPGLDRAEMKSLQSALRDLGYDVGKLDGILGAQTRRAVQEVQSGLGLPADAWPTWALLNAL